MYWERKKSWQQSERKLVRLEKITANTTRIEDLSVTNQKDEAKPIIYDELSHSLGRKQKQGGPLHGYRYSCS